MSFYDKNMQKGRLKHTKAKKGETGNHPQKVPGLQKRAPAAQLHTKMFDRWFRSLLVALVHLSGL